MDDLPKPKLGINGSPDKASGELVMRLLGAGSSVVSYAPGVPNAKLARKLKVKQEVFVLADWLDRAERSEVEGMVAELTDLVEGEKLTAWLKRVPFAELAAAVERGAPVRRKLVAIMDSGN